MASNYKRLGNYIQQVDVRNKDLSVNLLLGVSIEKKFIESHANTVGTDFKNYKIVKRGQFAYGPVTSRNGDKISIALLEEADVCLISSSYTTFEIIKPEELNAEYLMMLFRNPVYDRFARYNSWGSAREVFSWNDFCDSELYIPNIEEQQKIVRQYKTITDRIGVLEKINEELLEVANINYLKYIETNDFTEIDIQSLAKLAAGGDTPEDKVDTYDDEHPIPIFSNGTKDDGLFGYTKKAKITQPSITISARGYIGYTVLHTEPYTPAVRLISVTPNDKRNLEYLYFYFKNLKYADNGSAQQQATIPYFKTLSCFCLNDKQLTEFNGIMEPFLLHISCNKKQIIELKKISNVILSKLI